MGKPQQQGRRIRKRADITPDMVRQVQACAASGCDFKQTAFICDIRVDDLRTWMADVWNKARAQSVATMGAALFSLGKGDPANGIRPNLGAQRSYLEYVGGWHRRTSIVFEEPKDEASDQARAMEAIKARLERLRASRKPAEATPPLPPVDPPAAPPA